jgi:hypothetical protein
MTDRDPLLAEELERLPVPEHSEEFFPSLRTRLEHRPPRTWQLGRLPYVGAAAAAAAAAIAFAVADLTGGAERASAAEVRNAVAHALSSADRLGGVLAVREHASGGELRWRFLLEANGDFRAEALPTGPVWAYDAAENVERNSDEGLFTVRSGIAPGPPDSTSSDWMIQRGLGAVVRALDAAGDASVREVEYRGRPAWVLVTHTQNEGEIREIVVDRHTGVPVRDVRTFRGTRSEWRIDDLQVGYASTDGPAFRLKRRPDQQLTRYDHGFRRSTLVEAAGAVGYEPLVPAWLPAGYERAEVAVARSSRPTGNEQHQNPPSRDVVSVAYRRGLDEIVVTTRRVGRDRSAWSDPVAIGDPSRPPARTTLSAGALAGVSVEIAVDPNSVPHLWGMTPELVVTVAGDVTRDELVRVAESLGGPR